MLVAFRDKWVQLKKYLFVYPAQEIGLHSLTHIRRGSVRIMNNPLLCYGDSIDWTAIAANTQAKEHFVTGNKKDNECPVCPTSKKSADNINELACKASPKDSKKGLCWNMMHCQHLCPPECGNRTCSATGACCNELCVGGCTSDNPNQCASCRDLRATYSNNSFRCVKKCPEGYYAYNDYRCVLADECRNITIPFTTSAYELNMRPYVPFEGICQVTCPVGHQMVESKTNGRECQKCDGPCQKECEYGNIDSIATAQRFRGCNRILGDLLIQIRNQGGSEFVEDQSTHTITHTRGDRLSSS